MTDPLDEAMALIAQMLPLAERLNELLAPLPKRDPSNRWEPVWNAHSTSGGVVMTLKRTNGWLVRAKAKREHDTK